MDYEEQQFEQDLSSEERCIDSKLSKALQEHVPQGLEDRIARASAPNLQGLSMELLLDEAFHPAVPEGLEQRVFNFSRDDLFSGQAVIATIGRNVFWRQASLVACILFAVLLAIWFDQEPDKIVQPTQMASNTVLSLEEEELLFEDLNLGQYSYLADTRELAFADLAVSLEGLRDDLELWQYGLLTE